MDYRDIEAGATEDFCWFKAKLELIDILLAKAGIKNRAKIKILSAGCGIGREMEIIKEYGDIYAIDIDPGIIASLPDGLCIEKRVCDVCDTSLYPDNFFDTVVAFDLLEHCKDDTPAIKEIRRVLKPNGLFVFTVPAFQSLFSGHDRALSHYRRYNRRILKESLFQFKCIELGFWVCSLFLPIAVERLLKRNKTAVHYSPLPAFINNLFYKLLRVENWLIRHRIPLPIGTTIYGIYQVKKDNNTLTV